MLYYLCIVTESIQGLSTEVFSSGQKIALVLLHGYGANGRDLVSLREMIVEHGSYDWYFPEAPLSISLGMGLVGKGWFPLRVAQLAQHNSQFYREEPHGLREVTETLRAFLEQVRRDHSRVYLGGFSQGAIVSTNATMHYPYLVDKLFILSGTLINEDKWQEKLHGMREIPTFQSHGREDGVLPFSGAEALDKLLLSKTDHQFCPFSGGHEIPLTTLDALSRFLHG